MSAFDCDVAIVGYGPSGVSAANFLGARGVSPLRIPPSIAAGWVTGAGGAVGRFVPQPRVAGADGRLALLDAMTGGKLVVLGGGVDPRDLLGDCQRRDWDAAGAGYHAVRSPSEASEAPSDIIDIDGAPTAWMRAHGARVIAVRPDFFVAASDATGLTVPIDEKRLVAAA